MKSLNKLLIIQLLCLLILMPNYVKSKNLAESIDNTIFFKIGYIPLNPVMFDSKQTVNGVELAGNAYTDYLAGYSLELEYIKTFGQIITGIGVEYQSLYLQDSGWRKEQSRFITPQLFIKYLFNNGIMTGFGPSFKFMASSDTNDDRDIKKEKDIWINGFIGYFYNINDTLKSTIEARFGYNITHRQYENQNDSSIGVSRKYDVRSFDTGIYLGIGYKLF